MEGKENDLKGLKARISERFLFLFFVLKEQNEPREIDSGQGRETLFAVPDKSEYYSMGKMEVKKMGLTK